MFAELWGLLCGYLLFLYWLFDRLIMYCMYVSDLQVLTRLWPSRPTQDTTRKIRWSSMLQPSRGASSGQGYLHVTIKLNKKMNCKPQWMDFSEQFADECMYCILFNILKCRFLISGNSFVGPFSSDLTKTRNRRKDWTKRKYLRNQLERMSKVWPLSRCLG